MSGMDELGVAAWRKIRAQNELAAANLHLALALSLIHTDGLPKCHVAAAARENLAMHGFEPDHIARLGLSDGNVRLILDRK